MAVAEKVKGGEEVILSNLVDSLAKAERQIGAGLGETWFPIIKGISEDITMLVNSGALKTTFAEIGDIFGFDPSSSPFEDGLIRVLATMKGLAQFTANFIEGAKGIFDFGTNLRDRIVKIALDTNPFVQGIEHLMGDKKEEEGKKYLKDAFGISAYEDEYNSIKAQIAAQKRKDHKNKGKPDNRAPEVGNPIGDPTIPYLQKIADNTKTTAVELKKYAFGGGDLGRLGVTSTEMQGFYGSQTGLNSGGGSAMRNVVTSLNQLLSQEVTKKITDMIRAGYLRTN